MNVFDKNKDCLPIYRFVLGAEIWAALDVRKLFEHVFPAVEGSVSTIPLERSMEHVRDCHFRGRPQMFSEVLNFGLALPLNTCKPRVF